MRGAWGTEPDRLDAVEAALGRAGEGPAVVLIEGALGTGKSTLLDAVAVRTRERDAGPVVLRARGSRRERDVPLGVVRQLLHARPGPGGPSAEAVGWYLAELAERPRAGVLLVVDDAEHADDASLAALEALELRRPNARCGLLLATARAAGRPALLRLQAGSDAVRLGPLPRSRVSQLIRQQVRGAGPAYVENCLRVTGGIPLLLAALLQHPPEPAAVTTTAPEPLVRRVRAELAELSPAARSVAEAVAVLGPGVGLSDAGTLTGLDRRAVGTAADELAAAGLLCPGAPLTFAQPLLATAVRTAIAPHARSALHRSAAQLLASQCAAADLVDAHLLRTFPAGEPWVAERLVQAAHRAEDAHDPGAVVDLLARAAAEPPPLPNRAPVLVALAAAKMSLGDASAGSELEQALRLPAAPGLAAHARNLLAQLHHLRGRTGDGVSVLEESLASADDTARGPLLARYLSLTGLDARYRAKVEALAAPLVAAARAGSLPRDPGLAAHVAWRLAVSAAPVDLVLACAHRAFAVDPLVAPETQGELLGFAVRALLAVDRIAEAEQACTRALESARSRGWVLAVGFARYHRALARLAAGALDDALADVLGTAEPALRGWTRGDIWRCELTARIQLARGETTAAGALLALDAPAPPTSLGWAFARQAEAQLALAERRPDAAAELAARAGACLRALGQEVPALLPWRLTAARAAWRAQRPEEARATATQALAAARAHLSRVAVGNALVTAGVVAPPDDRVALLREACAVLAGTPALSERAGALIALGRALRQTGARTEARGLLREGLDLALSLSAGSLAQTARAELAAAGARPRRERLRGPAALTASERRVADLAAAGRTNAGIGGELSIGRKTVESHLAQVYRKLGISGRGELDGALGTSPRPGVSAESSGWRP